jgi:hypothetical protein
VIGFEALSAYWLVLGLQAGSSWHTLASLAAGGAAILMLAATCLTVKFVR